MIKILRKIRHREKGYSLVELLVSMVILVIILSTVLVIVNPIKRKAQAEDYDRYNDIVKMAIEVRSYIYGNYGEMVNCSPSQDIPDDNTWYCIGAAGLMGCMNPGTIGFPDNGCNLSENLIPEYLIDLPLDPATNNGTIDTGYAVKRSGSVIYIKAPYVSKYHSEDEMIVNTIDL